MAADWLVNGTALSTLMTIQGIDGDFPTKRGENIWLPYATYPVYVPKTETGRLITVRGVMVSVDHPNYNADVEALANLLWSPDDPLTVRRHTPKPSGVEVKEATAEHIGPALDAEMVAANAGRVALEFQMLSAWTVL